MSVSEEQRDINITKTGNKECERIRVRDESGNNKGEAHRTHCAAQGFDIAFGDLEQ